PGGGSHRGEVCPEGVTATGTVPALRGNDGSLGCDPPRPTNTKSVSTKTIAIAHHRCRTPSSVSSRCSKSFTRGGSPSGGGISSSLTPSVLQHLHRKGRARGRRRRTGGSSRRR